MNLHTRAWLGLIFPAFAVGLLLFVSAGTVDYRQAWGYLAIFFGSSVFQTLYLMKHDPALLQRRLKGGPTAEHEWSQKIIMLGATIGFIALTVVPGLDHRFGWSSVPLTVVIAGYVLVAVGFYVIFLVFRENTFTSATIEIAEDQKVISTGPYACVRHPMYAGGLLYLFGMPLALGSFWGLLALAGTMPFLIWRLFDEERFLAKKLSGYSDYMKKVRWRLVPDLF
jgi:protein-S-isoprenylcysteine O-methyltransferase Ste14